YSRISPIPIAIPALRERPEDFPYIARHLLQKISVDMARAPGELSPRAMQRLYAYYWPGNIRELRNVLERALLLTDKPVLEPADFVFEAKADHRPKSYDP